jgi:hypothetical protein
MADASRTNTVDVRTTLTVDGDVSSDLLLRSDGDGMAFREYRFDRMPAEFRDHVHVVLRDSAPGPSDFLVQLERAALPDILSRCRALSQRPGDAFAPMIVVVHPDGRVLLAERAMDPRPPYPETESDFSRCVSQVLRSIRLAPIASDRIMFDLIPHPVQHRCWWATPQFTPQMCTPLP